MGMGDLATWVSGVGTIGACIIALVASRTGERIRQDDLSREAQRKKDMAARLAMTFHKDIQRAIRELKALRSVANTLSAENADACALIIARPLPDSLLWSINRFASELDGFAVRDAADLLHLVGVWRDLPLPGVRSSKIPGEVLFKMKQVILDDMDVAIKIMIELQNRLAEYFKDVSGITFVSEDDLRRERIEKYPEAFS